MRIGKKSAFVRRRNVRIMCIPGNAAKKKRQWEMSERFVTRRRYNTILRTHGEDWEDRLHLLKHHNG
jgi:hypothetical protein